MRPSARLQAAIEVLDEIIEAARDQGPAADVVVQRFFQKRRYAGSGDRRAIRELVYRAIRRSGERPLNGRAAMLGVAQDDPDLLPLFEWAVRAPVPVLEGEPVADASPLAPWLAERLDPLVGPDEIPALLERAPLDLRANRLKASREECLDQFPDASPTALSPLGLRLTEGSQIESSEAWKTGMVDVQDEGSQLVALACGAAGGSLVLDLCAGAGGKTLALAAEMENSGRLIAADVDRSRLSRLTPRATRAGATNIQTLLLDPRKERAQLAKLRERADVVLVDAPCSGSGTWRRNPETRWRMTEERLRRIETVQRQLLDIASELVRPGGLLVYAVCSLLAEEGRGQARAFGERHSSFRSDDLPIKGGREAGAGRLLTPDHDGTDGFFIARWRRP
jgi:16S rRNA (cytosine967-C5)-methyltransferase